MNVKRLFIVILMGSILSPIGFAQTADRGFDTASYISQCGGSSSDIYSKCDSNDLSQITIFDQANAAAMKSNKKVFLVIGANWCHYCHLFHNLWEAQVDAVQKIKKNFVFVELNFDASSTKQLMSQLSLSPRGVPYAVEYDPVTKKVVKQFYPNSYPNMNRLNDYLLSN